MVRFPAGEPQEVCALCREPFEQHDPEFASGYANLVCNACDDRAVFREEIPRGAEASYAAGGMILEYDDGTRVMELPAEMGTNPVYIDGNKCWRRYRFGGKIARLDEYDCDSLEEFYATHRPDAVEDRS